MMWKPYLIVNKGIVVGGSLLLCIIILLGGSLGTSSVVAQQPSPTFSPTPSSTFTPSFTPSPTLPRPTDVPTQDPNFTTNQGTPAAPVAQPTTPPQPTQPPEPVQSPTTEAVTQPQSGRLEIGETRENEIFQAGEVHRYTFFGTAEDVISVVVNPKPLTDDEPDAPEIVNPLDPYIELQAPSGDIVAENDNFLENAPDAAITQFEIPTTGVYTLYIRSTDEIGTGVYWLTVDNQPLTLRDVERGVAERAVFNEQTLETYGSREIWAIELTAGNSVIVSVESLVPDLDVMVEMVSPSGEAWFDNDSGLELDAYLENIVVPEDGIYIIHVATRNNATIGDYRLWWDITNDRPTPIPPTATPAPTATPLPTALPASGTLQGSVNQNDIFIAFLPASAGQTINIVVQGIAAFDPVLRVSTLTGNIIVEVDDVAQSQDPRTQFIVDADNQYVIEIFGYEGQAGEFTLNYIVQ